jgi:antirestriction protein ArdC
MPYTADNKSPPRDHRLEVTNDVIRLMEENQAPWQKPWDAGTMGHIPFNPTTGKAYRGGNIIGLLVTSLRRGYTDPRFCTYRQAQEKGWQVRKGEKGTAVEFWEIKPYAKAAPDSDDEQERARMIHSV